MTRHLTLLLIAVLVLTGCQGPDNSGAAGAPIAPVAQDQQRAAAGPAPASSARDGITVVGRGRVAGEPDTLRATVGVHVVRPDVDEAFTAASTAADQVVTALREHGVSEEDIQTREFSVRPEREARPDQAPAPAAETARRPSSRAVRGHGELRAGVRFSSGVPPSLLMPSTRSR